MAICADFVDVKISNLCAIYGLCRHGNSNAKCINEYDVVMILWKLVWLFRLWDC
jgi:hypothetical protein